MTTSHAALSTVRAAWESADNATRAQRIRDAVVWAGFTVLQRTEAAETLFGAWLDMGRPTLGDMVKADVPLARSLFTSRNRRMQAVAALDDATLLEIASDARTADGAAEARLADLIPGLSIVKASFSLASAGCGYLGCLDSRGIDDHAETLIDIFAQSMEAIDDALGSGITLENLARATMGKVMSRKGMRNGSDYVNLCRTLWGDDSASGQWSEWLTAMADEGRPVDHACLSRLGESI